MPHPRFKTSRLRRRTAKNRTARRLLLAESLERRLLLTLVTSVQPLANSSDAPLATDISATFDQDVTAANDQSFVVHTSQRGQLVGSATTVSSAGTTASHTPANSLFPGETVQVTVTSSLTTAGGAAVPRVWKFHAGTTAGSGEFSRSDQSIGDAAANRSSYAVALGDLDGDGDLDAFVVNNGVGDRVYLNNGGIFTDTGQSLGNNQGREVALGDLDGDGDLDAIVANVAGQGDRVWQNDGNANFSEAQVFAGSTSQGVVLGDLDGDGDLDAFVVQSGSGNRVFRNDSGTLNDTGQALGNHASQSAQLGDLDGDGDLDAFVANAGYQPNRVWLNNGNGAFSTSGQSLGFHTSVTVDLGDVDGDGDLDAFVGNSDQHNRVWLNTGSAVFTDSGQLLARAGSPLGNRYTRTEWVELGDLDGDGDLDLFAVNDNGGPNRAYLNDGAGIFTDTGQDLFDNTATHGMALGDVDGDGDLDAFVVNDVAPNNQNSVSRLWINQNLVPSVTLSIDNATLSEAAGVANVTATLSEVFGQPVTIDLGFGGTATETADYTRSASQIVIPAGSLAGSISVTSVQDTADEPDETIIIDITSVTNGVESGSQQVTTTIIDDDLPPMPDVTLTVDNASISEAGGSAVFTATLSEATSVAVTVQLGYSGTASSGDYTVTSSEIVIAPGATAGTVTATAIDDDQNEADETVVVDIAAVQNGLEAGQQQATTTITDDDAPPQLAVTSLVQTTSGFIAEFSADLDPAPLNLYDTEAAGLGPADVQLVGAASGPVAGSLVVDPSLRRVTFIKSGGPLAADTYTVTLRSGVDGFVDIDGRLLDGDADGNPGDDLSDTFSVAEPAVGAITVAMGDFVRGPGQPVNLPADTASGIPLTLSEGTGVRAIDVRIGYDPAQLEITGATVADGMPAGASVIVNTNTPGLAILVFFSSTALPAGSGTFVNLQAAVPTADAAAVYQAQQVLDVHGVTISDGNDNEFPVVADDALQLATYFGDVSGNRRINASDASQIARFAALIDAGFSGSPLTDPVVAGDITGNGRINAADASRVAQFAALIDVPEIPPVPGGVQFAGLHFDSISESSELAAAIEVVPAVPLLDAYSAGPENFAAVQGALADFALAEMSSAAEGEASEDALADTIAAILSLDDLA